MRQCRSQHKHEATLARQIEETRPMYSDLSIDTVKIFRGLIHAGVAVAEADDGTLNLGSPISS